MTAITVRTITLGIGAPHPLTAVTLGRAGAFLRKAQAAMEQAGYLVQTTHVVPGNGGIDLRLQSNFLRVP